MFEIKMNGAVAHIYSDPSSSIKSVADILTRLERLSEKVVVDSLSVDERLKLSQSDLEALQEQFIITKQEVEQRTAPEKFNHSPISVSAAYKRTLYHIAAHPSLFAASHLPFLITSLLLSLAAPSLIETLLGKASTSQSVSLVLVPMLVIGLWGLIKTSVALHSFFLTSQSSSHKDMRISSIFGIKKVDFKFLWCLILVEIRLALVSLIFVLPLALIVLAIKWTSLPALISLLVVLILVHIYFLARYSLSLSATVEGTKDRRTSWSFLATKGNGWRIGIGAFLLPVTVEVGLSFAPIIPFDIISVISRMIYMSLSIGMLVYSYLHVSLKIDDSLST